MSALRQRMIGPHVRRWQEFLIAEGFLRGAADSTFGPKTHAATKKVQGSKKVRVEQPSAKAAKAVKAPKAAKSTTEKAGKKAVKKAVKKRAKRESGKPSKSAKKGTKTAARKR